MADLARVEVSYHCCCDVAFVPMEEAQGVMMDTAQVKIVAWAELVVWWLELVVVWVTVPLPGQRVWVTAAAVNTVATN